MKADDRKPERVLKLLLENFPEQPRSQTEPQSLKPKPDLSADVPLLISLAGNSATRGIWELNSALSE